MEIMENKKRYQPGNIFRCHCSINLFLNPTEYIPADWSTAETTFLTDANEVKTLLLLRVVNEKKHRNFPDLWFECLVGNRIGFLKHTHLTSYEWLRDIELVSSI